MTREETRANHAACCSAIGYTQKHLLIIYIAQIYKVYLHLHNIHLQHIYYVCQSKQIKTTTENRAQIPHTKKSSLSPSLQCIYMLFNSKKRKQTYTDLHTLYTPLYTHANERMNV